MGRVLGTASVLVSAGDQRHAPDSTAEAGQTALIPGPLGTRKRTANQLHGSVTWDQARSGKYLLYHAGTWGSQVHSGHDNELDILACGVVPLTPASGVRHSQSSERRSPPLRRPTLRTSDDGISSSCEAYNISSGKSNDQPGSVPWIRDSLGSGAMAIAWGFLPPFHWLACNIHAYCLPVPYYMI